MLEWGQLIIAMCAAYTGSWFGTRGTITLANWLDVIDHPNHRSSHEHPTPRLGGIAIAVSATLTLLGWGAFGLPGSRQLTSILFGCAILGGVGVCDDFRSIRAWIRLGAQGLIAGGFVIFYLPVATTPVWTISLGIVAAMWFVNLFNFMDGLDGFAASEAIFVLLAAGAAGAVARDPLVAGLAMIVAAAIAGFLSWNWSPARMFLGDGGSYWIGAFLVAVLAAATQRGVVSLPTALILPAPFVADATLCLCRRIVRRERVWVGHRMHAYQRAADRFGGAAPVVRWLMAINLVIVLPGALAAHLFPLGAWGAVAVVYAVCGALAIAWRSGAQRTVGDESDPAVSRVRL